MIAFVDHVDSSAEISSIVSVFSIVQVTEGNWVNEAFQELHNHQKYRFDLRYYTLSSTIILVVRISQVMILSASISFLSSSSFSSSIEMSEFEACKRKSRSVK